MIHVYNFAWLTISNYFDPPPKKKQQQNPPQTDKFLDHYHFIVTSGNLSHSSAWLPLVTFHTEEVTLTK